MRKVARYPTPELWQIAVSKDGSQLLCDSVFPACQNISLVKCNSSQHALQTAYPITQLAGKVL